MPGRHPSTSTENAQQPWSKHCYFCVTKIEQRHWRICVSLATSSINESNNGYVCLFRRYDHLVDIIKRIIVERPKNVVDYFEDFSRRIRQDRYRGDERTQRGFYSTTYRMDVSLTILAGLAVCILLVCFIFRKKKHSFWCNFAWQLNTEPLFLTNSFVNEWMERQSHWSSAGIGFSHEKQLQLTLAMQGLLTNSIVQDARCVFISNSVCGFCWLRHFIFSEKLDSGEQYMALRRIIISPKQHWLRRKAKVDYRWRKTLCSKWNWEKHKRRSNPV